MQALSGLDSSFLYLETPNMPMHIGGLDVYDGSLSFEEFREFLAARLYLAPRLMQRLVQVPLSLDHPYWIDDPDFNIDFHLHHTALPRPGGWRQLRQLASRIFSQPLNRSRPLWEFVFVEGLDTISQVPKGSVALISKVHHAAIDGASGAEILGLLFDPTPNPRKLNPPAATKVPPVPSDMELIARSAYHFAKRPFKLPRLLLETAQATLNAGRLTRVQGAPTPVMPFAAPRTILNGPVSPMRLWNTALLALDRVKALRKGVEGSTVNDVVLAICTNALRRYLDEKGKLPAKPLVAMVPVSVRGKGEKKAMGNQVSAMLIQLPTDVADPLEQLEKIHERTQQGKAFQSAVGAKTLMDYAEFVPFGLGGQAARLYTRMEVSKHHNPLFNVVITNVPGPQVPLYMNGRPLLAHMGMAPIFDGMGLILPVFSYNGILSISPTTATNIMPDVDLFARYLREAANELEALVLAIKPKTDSSNGSVSASNSSVGASNGSDAASNGRCQATTKSGNPCRNQSQVGSTTCYVHRLLPDDAEKKNG